MSSALRRIALVIGNAAYQGSPLKNPANDARDIAASLSRIGFSGIRDAVTDVSTRLDLDYNGLRAALADFAEASHGAEQAVLYYAGHGLEYQGENYLIPVDARLEHAKRLDFEAAALGQILRNVDDQGGLRLIILDACRNNHFRARLFGVRDMGRGLRAVEPQGGVLVAYAAKHGTVALDGEGRNSPFAKSLLAHLEKPGLEVAQLFREVRDDVLENTGREQEPHLYGSLGRKQEYLVPPTPVAATPFIHTVDAATREHTFWLAIANSRDPLAFEDFLEKFPDGTYSRLAIRTTETAIDHCANVDTLERLIRQHPESPRVARAQARLTKLMEPRKPFRFDWRAGSVAASALAGGFALFVATSDALFGNIKVLIGRGATEKTLWLKEGRDNLESPESFRDCENCPEMIIVSAGKFLMGSTKNTDPNRDSDEDDGNGRQVEITIPKPFAVGRFEVTFDEWEACVADGGCKSNMTPSDSGFGKGRRPVINVSWRDAQEYVAWINAKAPADYPYRLLSEAEWEYAARAVTTATPQPPYFFGADEKKLCDYGNVADRAATKKDPELRPPADCDDGEATTAPVGNYRPNPFGLKDTIGNVSEWVEDCYRDSYKNMPAGVRATGKPWLDGCQGGSDRVLRGGSWNYIPGLLRSAVRI